MNEKSERALQLTKDAAILNPANYTVWYRNYFKSVFQNNKRVFICFRQYRREILKHMNKDLHDELKFCRDIIDENPKNYQIWC